MNTLSWSTQKDFDPFANSERNFLVLFTSFRINSVQHHLAR